MSEVHGGVVVAFDAPAADAVGLAALAFLPAQVARRVALASGAIALGGAPPLALGLALVEGRLLTLIAVGSVEARGPIVICERPDGGAFALGVLSIVGTGVFDGGDDGVRFEGGFAPRLDVVELLQRIESAVWITRAPRSPSSLPPPSPAPHRSTAPRGA